jgi:hypothetical protein
MIESDCVKTEVILDVQRCKLKEVKYEVRQMWCDFEARNGDYIPFDVEEYIEEDLCPHICKFLNDLGVKSCLVHWWW